MARLPLLIGESPSRSGDRYHHFPLSGAVGQTLCEFAGIEPEVEGSRYGRYYWALRDRFDCVNVFDRFAQANPWSVPRAREAWTRRLLTELQGDDALVAVCLGRRAAEALGHDRPFHEWFNAGLLWVVTIPHPSSRNRVYNDPAERVRSGNTLRLAMQGAAVESDGTRRMILCPQPQLI